MTPQNDTRKARQFRQPGTIFNDRDTQPPYQLQPPVTERHHVPQHQPFVAQRRPTSRRKQGVIFMGVVLSVLLVIIVVSVMQLTQKGIVQPQTQQKSSAPTQVSTTPVTPALNSITNNKEISPLLFGTNMGLYHDADEPILHDAKTRQLLKDIGVRAIRMPTRPTLSDQTEIAAAQAIKEIGAVPLVIIAGPGYPGGSILQTNKHTLDLMHQVFGNQPVYYEFGNESDLAGISVEQYVAVWNQVVPTLKQLFPDARFIGPDNYQFTRRYLKTFLQQAQPRPDGVSWHEYTCSINWSADFCMANIDSWNIHFTQARAAMQEAIGTTLPIWITEWNYASDTNGQLVNDGKSTNSAFMQAWTTKAMQTLVANRVFASMQYFATDAPMPLVANDQIGIEGKMFQQAYQNVMVAGSSPPPAKISYPTPTSKVNPHEAFSFEGGDTGGWMSIGNGITQPISSTARAFDGTHSLQITLKNASEDDTPFIAVSANQLPSVPRAGQMITTYIYVANKAALVNAKIFVANTQHGWLFANSTTLTAGQWNKVWFALPLNFSNQVSQIGIQFFTSQAGVSSDVYIDAINWQ